MLPKVLRAIPISFLVFFGVVLATIELNDQTPFMALKICDEAADRVLSPKTEPLQLSLA